MGKITVTVKQVFEALEKNGFEHIRGSWFKFSETNSNLVVGGCVLGQAAINLGVLQPIDSEDDYEIDGSLVAALDRIKPTTGKWNEERYFSGLAEQIIYWNDKTKRINGKLVYALPTWEDVVEMARDCMTPHFKEKITLSTYEWNSPVLVG